jgi:hypothetical protein
LMDNSAPILRLRVARDLLEATSPARFQDLHRQALETPEMDYWLSALRQSRNIHGSRDTDAENALSKLAEYGLDRQDAVLDELVQPLLAQPWRSWENYVLPPFLMRLGYAGHPRLEAAISGRLEALYQTALNGSFDFYLATPEALKVPKAWRGKPIYRDEFGHASDYPLPTCYDLLALSSLPTRPLMHDQQIKSEAVMAFLSDPRFQSTPGGYGWDRPHHRCYAAGRVFLACVEPTRLVLFMELAAASPVARRAPWFRQGLAFLEAYHTERGTYIFPRTLMQEPHGSHIYAGAHMGLGESRHSPLRLELESTFRMLLIQKRMLA